MYAMKIDDGEHGGRVTEVDVEPLDVADRQWWDDVQAFADGAGFDVAGWEAEREFLDCGCGGKSFSCGHYGWRAAILKAAS